MLLGLTFQEITTVWLDGGWVMVPLGLLAFFIYFSALELFFYFSKGNQSKVSEPVYTRWIEDPHQGEGHVGEIIRYVSADQPSQDDVRNRFSEILTSSVPQVDRRLVFLNVLVTVSPLMGLLGTVIGMLSTFQALATGSGKTVDMVASGISEALITTQTGLIIAIPGYLLVSAIQKKRNEYVAFLVRLESLVLQKFHRESQGRSTSIAGNEA